MIPHGKGKIAAIILARMKEKDSSKSDSYGSDSSERSDKEVDPGMESAMEDFASALSNKDYAGMAQALCEFIHCHENSEEASEDNEA